MNLIYTKKKMLQLKKIFHLKHYIIAYSSLKCIFNYNLLYIIILNTKLFNLDILNSKILNF